jgi:hypothetical protein
MILGEMPDGKRPAGRLRHTRKWEDNIKIDLRYRIG